MNKKILIICLVALVVISASATLVISSIADSKEDTGCTIDPQGRAICDKICSWCYFTDYGCNSEGTCC